MRSALRCRRGGVTLPPDAGKLCAWGGRKMQPDQCAACRPQSAGSLVEQIREDLEERIGSRNFGCWFRDKTSLVVEQERVTVGVGSPFLLSWMQRHFREPVLAAATAVLGPSAQIQFEVDSSLPWALQPAATNLTARDAGGQDGNGAAPRTGRAEGKKHTSSGRRFADLNDLVQGGCNALALTAARQVCEAPGRQFNPLYVHGAVGVGKTHLLEGIYRSLRRDYPALQVTFLTAEVFANYFTQALRDHTLPSFRQRFRTVDVLIVDDVQFLESKRVIQEEFLHTVKQLESYGRQIVLAGDRHPRLYTKISDELTTRMLSGLVCRIEPPDADTREQILLKRLGALEIEIAPDALKYIASRFSGNVRELEGALHCLHAHYRLQKRRITVALAQRLLSDLERDCVRVIRMSDIERAVCEVFGVESQDLKSPRRHRSISHPRMLAMFLARKHTPAAYAEIGHYFGGRNHSTVVSAERRVRSWLDDDTSISLASGSWSVADLVSSLEHQILNAG